LPAARQASGCAHHSSHFFCSVCHCYGIPTMYRTDFDHPDWKPRDANLLREKAEAWRDATTLKERDAIFEEYGVRWSELWRLPYWNPSRMLVIDSMHCILEGLVHYHCRQVLEIDAETVSTSDITFIQNVIKNTAVPSWISSVPRNYGESSAGSMKADEWRLLATVYLPIALILLWGQDNLGENSAHFFAILQHTMAIFQATTIVCRYGMNLARASAFRTLMKEWLDGLPKIHPHTESHHFKPNAHAAFHIYDFLLLFGPIISWWCFPFERLIGIIQKIKTNDQ
ncbi:hypothetical protein DFH06DRAFT_917167, partial [Mycena polygramma]